MTTPADPSAPRVDEALQQRAAQALHAAGGPFTNADPETLAAAVLAELAPELARAQRAEAAEFAMRSTAADALKHGGCHRTLMAQVRRAERAEAALDRVRKLADRWDRDAPLPGNRPLTELRTALDTPTQETP